MARAPPRVRQRHADGHLAVRLHRGLPRAQVAVGEGRVAQALAELELRAGGEVAERRVRVLERLAVVVEKVIDRARVREREAASGVEVAEEHVGHGLPALVRGVVGHQYRARAVGDAVDDARSAFDEDEHHGLARRLDCLGEFQLRLAQCQVGDVAGRLGVRAFAEAEDDRVGVARGACGGGDVNLFVGERRRAGGANEPRAGHVGHVRRADSLLDGAPNGQAVFRVERLLRPLPDVSPPVVERDERVGGRACDEHLAILIERKKVVVVLQERHGLARRLQ